MNVHIFFTIYFAFNNHSHWKNLLWISVFHFLLIGTLNDFLSCQGIKSKSKVNRENETLRNVKCARQSIKKFVLKWTPFVYLCVAGRHRVSRLNILYKTSTTLRLCWSTQRTNTQQNTKKEKKKSFYLQWRVVKNALIYAICAFQHERFFVTKKSWSTLIALCTKLNNERDFRGLRTGEKMNSWNCISLLDFGNDITFNDAAKSRFVTRALCVLVY